jgi:hypothetical protein
LGEAWPRRVRRFRVAAATRVRGMKDLLHDSLYERHIYLPNASRRIGRIEP